MKTKLEVLKEARELISVPERWTQDSSARDSYGEPVGPHSKYAVCWCSTGAIDKSCGGELGGLDLYRSATTSLREPMKLPVIIYNDNHTHAEVLSMFDEAIRIAEMEQ